MVAEWRLRSVRRILLGTQHACACDSERRAGRWSATPAHRTGKGRDRPNPRSGVRLLAADVEAIPFFCAPVEGELIDFRAQDWYTRRHRARNKCLILLDLDGCLGNPSLSAIPAEIFRSYRHPCTSRPPAGDVLMVPLRTSAANRIAI